MFQHCVLITSDAGRTTHKPAIVPAEGFLAGHHSLLILFLRLGWETRIPPVPRDCFGLVQVGNDILKKIYWANIDFL